MIAEYKKVKIKASGTEGTVIDVFEKAGETLYVVEDNEMGIDGYGRDIFTEDELEVKDG